MKAIFLLLALPAAAATVLDPADSAATDQNYRDEALLYPAVGNTNRNLNGSGVLIGDRWVLTAGHIAIGKAGSSFTLGGISYQVESTILHPAYTSSPQLSSDLGLLYLSTAVGNVTPALMYQFTDSLGPIGMEATWVRNGFGGNGTTGGTFGNTLAYRAFTNVIDVPGDHPDYEGLPARTFLADFDKPDGSTNNPSSAGSATRLEGNLAPGDSGGGVFVTIGGESYLVGVNSYRSDLDSTPFGGNSAYGSLSGATDLRFFHDWIFANTGIRPVPEPSAPLLALLGLAGLARRRRRV